MGTESGANVTQEQGSVLCNKVSFICDKFMHTSSVFFVFTKATAPLTKGITGANSRNFEVYQCFFPYSL